MPFLDRAPTLRELALRIRRAVGRTIMPTLVTPEGLWVQDTSDIIDCIDAAFPEPPTRPFGVRQRLVSALLEVHADEWLIMGALHFRWRRPESAAFAREQIARVGMPLLPGFVRRPIARRIAAQIAGYLPALGVTGAAATGCERYVDRLLGLLDAHLATHPYLLGDRPCVGDFALYGPLDAHFVGDPGATDLVEGRPHLRAFVERMRECSAGGGEFLADDRIPATLSPILRLIFAEQMDYMTRLVAAIDAYCEANPTATRLPGVLGATEFMIGGQTGTRKLFTFAQWKLQRAVRILEQATPPERQVLDDFIDAHGGARSLPQIRHPLERRSFRTFLRP